MEAVLEVEVNQRLQIALRRAMRLERVGHRRQVVAPVLEGVVRRVLAERLLTDRVEEVHRWSV